MTQYLKVKSYMLVLRDISKVKEQLSMLVKILNDCVENNDFL